MNFSDEFTIADCFDSFESNINPADALAKTAEIYPNPKEGLFSLILKDAPLEELELKIYSAVGAEIHSQFVFNK